jgi:hypothetical protein
VNRRPAGRTRWQILLLGARDLLRIDLGVTALATRDAGPTARKILFAPALSMLWLVDRLLPTRLR